MLYEVITCPSGEIDFPSPPEGGSPRKVPTPDKRTIGEVSAFLGIDPGLLIKTLLFETDKGDVAVALSGKHEVNEVKVKNFLGAEWVKLAA